MNIRKSLFTVAILSALVISSFLSSLKSPGKRLKAVLRIETGDMGIQGITKAYEARLVNRSLWPLRVHYCAFLGDDMVAGGKVAYRLERHTTDGQWSTIVESDGPSSCAPRPLSIAKAEGRSKLLWPGQSISDDEHAVAAMKGLKIGDRCQFVILTASGNDPALQVVSQEFVIDEHPKTDLQPQTEH